MNRSSEIRYVAQNGSSVDCAQRVHCRLGTIPEQTICQTMKFSPPSTPRCRDTRSFLPCARHLVKDAIMSNNKAVSAFEKGKLLKAKKLFSESIQNLESFFSSNFNATRNISSSFPVMASYEYAKGVKYQHQAPIIMRQSQPVGMVASSKDHCQRQQTRRDVRFFLYQSVFRIKVLQKELIVEQKMTERVMSTLLLNQALVHHFVSHNNHRKLKKTVRLYEAALRPSNDSFQESIIWNNLQQIFLWEMINFEAAVHCTDELKRSLDTLEDDGLLDQLRPQDRIGLLYNLAFSRPEFSAAA